MTFEQMAVQDALSVTAVARARKILERHHPGETHLFRGPDDQVISIDDSRRCQGCQATGWRPDYIMPWPCDAWKLATTVLDHYEDERSRG